MERVKASDLFTQEPCANPSCTNKMRVLDGERTFAVAPGWSWYSSRPGTGFKPVCSQNCQRTYRDLQDLTDLIETMERLDTEDPSGDPL